MMKLTLILACLSLAMSAATTVYLVRTRRVTVRFMATTTREPEEGRT